MPLPTIPIINYVLAFVAAFAASFVMVPFWKKVALRFGIMDDPKRDTSRKIQKKPIPFLGGMAVGLSFVFVLLGFVFGTELFLKSHLTLSNLTGIFIGVSFLMLGGFLDDKFDLPSKVQLLFSIAASASVVAGGIGVDFITNPFGGVFRLDAWNVKVFEYNQVSYFFTVWSDLFTFLWLMIMMYATKLLDGLDGLVSGISVISGFVLFLLSFSIHLPSVALLSIVFVGAQLGFLIYNFNPASIFLGEFGALFSGYILGILAISGSGKVATTLLVMGLPLLDMIWIIVRRIVWDRKHPFSSDKKHLHHRLLDVGLSQKQAVLFMYAIAALFGISALFLQSMGKLFALVFLCLFMIILGGSLMYLELKGRK